MDIGVSEPMSADLPQRRVDVLTQAVTIVPVNDCSQWNSLLSRAVVSHLPQSLAYGEAKRAKGWQVKRIAFAHDGDIIAVASVLQRNLLGLPIVTRVNRGPLLLDAALPSALIAAIYRALRRHRRGPLLIAPALPHGVESTQVLRQAGFRLRHDKGWQSARIDLTQGEEKIWAGFASRFRNRVRQGQKSGAIVETRRDAQSYEWLLERHVENMRDKRFTAADPKMLRALRHQSPEDVFVLQLCHAGEAVAGMSVVRFGSCAEYHIGWFGPQGRKLNAGNLLMWAAIQEMHRRGVQQFDVGGLREGDGYTQFKRTMRAAEFRLAGEWMSF